MRKFLALMLIALLLPLPSLAEGAGGFQLMAEDGGLRLYLDRETANVRIEDAATGRFAETKIMDGKQGGGSVKRLQKSDLNLTFIVNEKIGTVNMMDDYSMSVDPGNFTVEPLEKGFEIFYTVGDPTLVVDDLPKVIPTDVYSERMLPNWSSKEEDTFRDHYRVVRLEENEVWVRIKDAGLGALLIKQLHALIFETGGFTKEEMEAANAIVNYVPESTNPEFTISVRYELDGGDLLVSVPVGEIASESGHLMASFELLPYFLTGTTGDEGYIFVPDGNGAIINLNNQKTMATSYLARVYGSDVLKNASRWQLASYNAALPVYGIKAGDMALFAIIEKGQELAEIYADVSGRADEFNRVSARFVLRDIEAVSLVGNETITTPRYSEDVYQGDVQVRFKLLPGEDASYSGMARAYQAYLLERELLEARALSEQAPFYMELVGAFRKQRFFLGVPYWTTEAATTLSQAGEVYQAVREAGAENITVLYSGLFAGGVKHSSLIRARLDGRVGSEAELQALYDAVSADGGSLVPVAYLSRVYGTRNFSKSAGAARKHDGEPASVVTMATPIMKEGMMPYESFYLSPAYIEEYAQRASEALARYPLDGLAAADIATILTPDYRRNAHISRFRARESFERAMETLAESAPMYLAAPNLYALKYASAVYDLPYGDNSAQVVDFSVPFMQLVLDGLMPYSGESWNDFTYLGVRRQLLRAIETRSVPKFTFTYAPETVFHNTRDVDFLGYFTTQYEPWLEEIGALYEEYSAFYERVYGARIASHEILGGGVRRVAYDNGTVVYVNYQAEAALADGRRIPGESYFVVGGDKR